MRKIVEPDAALPEPPVMVTVAFGSTPPMFSVPAVVEVNAQAP